MMLNFGLGRTDANLDGDGLAILLANGCACGDGSDGGNLSERRMSRERENAGFRSARDIVQGDTFLRSVQVDDGIDVTPVLEPSSADFT